MSDRIEKRIELKAPVSRVWRALTDYREFGEWFRVKLAGPFVVGQTSSGYITHPGYEHVKWEALVQKMENERLFSSHGRISNPSTRPIIRRITRKNQPRSSNSGWRKLRSGPCWYSPSQASIKSQAIGASRISAGMTAAGREQMKNIEAYVAKNP